MSISAIDWVFRQDIRPSSVKFVFLALADNAGYEGDPGAVWPCLKTLCEKTSQDRKTVIAALDILEELKLLEDTGRRTGFTGQVKVYRIIGLPTDEKQNHYTYRLTHKDTKEYYLGVRSCHCTPEQDGYKGSGSWMRQKGVLQFLTKEILGTFKTRVEAEANENQIIRAAQFDPFCKNKVKGYRKRNGSAFPVKQSRISLETVPKTEPVTVIEPSVNHQGGAPPVLKAGKKQKFPSEALKVLPLIEADIQRLKDFGKRGPDGKLTGIDAENMIKLKDQRDKNKRIAYEA